uniref:Uncharacterized protein n=1 Tax=Arundo donax TaxID=35708 RepID=A0A0A9E8Q9_ARUDO
MRIREPIFQFGAVQELYQLDLLRFDLKLQLEKRRFNHSTRDMPRATSIPIAREIN